MKRLIVFTFMLILLCGCTSPAFHITSTGETEKGSGVVSDIPNISKTAEDIGIHMEALSPTPIGMTHDHTLYPVWRRL